jgi:hypothetical protein
VPEIKAGRERNEPPPAIVFNIPARNEATGSQRILTNGRREATMLHFTVLTHKEP